MNKKIKKKVLAYIVRSNNKKWQLLVFEHQDIPAAGIQIPGGTVEASDYNLSSAVLREVYEESGLKNLSVNAEVLSEIYYHSLKNEFQERHFFIIKTSLKNDMWSHKVKASGEDRGLQFNYYWKDIDTVSSLAGDQHIAIKHVLNLLENDI